MTLGGFYYGAAPYGGGSLSDHFDALGVEIEFTPGAWTDVSDYLDGTAGGTVRFGRTSPFSPPSVGTLTLTLANDDGRFTPERQLLSDGVTPHPYWPNVIPRKRIRVSTVIGGVPCYVFTGYIKGFPPLMVGGVTPRVLINATTVDDRLSRVQMQSPIRQEVLADSPAYYWPMTDPTGPVSAEAISGQSALALALTGSGGTVKWGDNGPGTGDGTGVKFTPSSGSVGRYLSRYLDPAKTSTINGWTVECWVNVGASAVNSNLFGVRDDTGFSETVYVDSAGIPQLASSAAATGPSIIDNAWHHIAFDWTGALTVDSVVRDTTVSLPLNISLIAVGETVYGGTGYPSRMLGNAGQVAVYGTALSPARIAAHYQSGLGFFGETSDQRIARFLSYGGLTSTDWDLDPSTVSLGTYPQAGKDIVTACQDTAISEGGSAVVYFGADGTALFRSRTYRKPAAPKLSVDAESDLDGSSYQPVFDDTQIVNQEQGSRATASATASTQTVNDTASQTAYGLISDSFTSYATDDADVLYNAQDRVAAQRRPTFRLNQVTLDLTTAETAGLFVAASSVGIGDRIRVTNLPSRAAPDTQLDVIVEGGEHQFSTDSYTIRYDTSPADNPAKALFDDDVYGRFQPDTGSMTLNADITDTAATVVVATAGGSPTFTTDPAAYPMAPVKIGTEELIFTTAPGGAGSPQTFTAVTRGVNGTTAAAQTAGAAVTFAKALTFAL